MSAESGISTFRDSNGLWEEYKIEEVATPQAWLNNPDLVTTFYNLRRKNILDAEPNKAHLAISQLEKIVKVDVITQNIDDLHERAGSTRVLHLHGNIRFAKSSGPNQEKKYYSIEGWELRQNDLCDEGYRLRPHVVWFGEAVPAYDEALSILRKADLLLVIGTSLQVYPAAGLIHHVPETCKKYIIDPNADSLETGGDFEIIKAGASEGIQAFIEALHH